MFDLLDERTKEWNLDAIKLHLPHYEELIKNLIPIEFNMIDELVWLPERSGVYSTKSGYVLSNVSGDQEAATLTGMHMFGK